MLGEFLRGSDALRLHRLWFFAAAALCSYGALAPARADGITTVGVAQLSPRLYEYSLDTPALSTQTHVRVLLPANYNASGPRRYPVLYLLNGGYGSYLDWTESGNVEALSAPYPLIIVMPDGGRGGWYSDWFNFGTGGTPRWETYHIDQLIQWVDTRFRTRGNRSGRAIAGLSMGGFGAVSYAARHPQLFGAVASFSGAVDIDKPQVARVVMASPPIDGGVPGAIFGSRLSHELIWKAHNPLTLATNLRNMHIWLYTGNGQPGPLDPPGTLPSIAGENVIEQVNIALHDELIWLDIAHTFVDYGPGTHAWPYWQRDLQQTLPQLMQAFAEPEASGPVNFETTDAAYSIDGWQVAISRLADEFSTLQDADRGGFTLWGSGDALVTTAPLFKAGQELRVTVTPQSQPQESSLRLADGQGRLQIKVPLGPANRQAEYTPASTAKVFVTTVTIGAP